MKALVFFSIFAGLIGSQAFADSGLPIAAMWENQTTVEILGTLKGVGALVLIEGKPRILTNSHVVQGMKTVSLTLPARTDERCFYIAKTSCRFTEPQKFSAKLEFDSPIADVAVLSPEGDSELLEELKTWASLNAEFCKPGASSCKGGVIFRSERLQGETAYINTISGNEKVTTKLISPYNATHISDSYISGLYDEAIRIPAFARPGMSGGSYYEQHQFAGLLSKIALDASGGAYAIPAKEIAKVLAPHYFKTSDSLNLPPSHWESTTHGYQLIVEVDGHVLTMPSSGGSLKNIGGDVGNGGGDVGNGGGKAKQEKLWNIEFEDQSGRHQAFTPNPFLVESKRQALTIDGKAVAYFKVWKSGTAHDSKNTRYLAPTLAHYLWLKRSGNYDHEVVFDSPDAKSAIIKERQTFPQSLKYARLYSKNASGQLELLAMNATAGLAIGPKPLTACADCNSQSVDPSPNLSRWMKSVMNATQPISENKSPNLVIAEQFDLKTAGSISKRFGESRFRDKAQIVMPKDLTKILYVYPEDSPADELLPVADLDPLTVQYRSSSGTAKAVVIFNDKQMAIIDRIFVESPDFIYEFVGCEIGKECVR